MSLRDLFTTPPPDVAVEIDHTHVAAARIAVRGNQHVIVAHASEALPPGAVVPGLAALNIPDVPVVAQAVGRVLAQLGGPKPTRVALVRARHGGQGLVAPAREGAGQGRRSPGDRQVAGQEDGAVPDGARGGERRRRAR